jgi:hypothetical protein
VFVDILVIGVARSLPERANAAFSGAPFLRVRCKEMFK